MKVQVQVDAQVDVLPTMVSISISRSKQIKTSTVIRKIVSTCVSTIKIIFTSTHTSIIICIRISIIILIYLHIIMRAPLFLLLRTHARPILLLTLMRNITTIIIILEYLIQSLN